MLMSVEEIDRINQKLINATLDIFTNSDIGQGSFEVIDYLRTYTDLLSKSYNAVRTLITKVESFIETIEVELHGERKLPTAEQDREIQRNIFIEGKECARQKGFRANRVYMGKYDLILQEEFKELFREIPYYPVSDSFLRNIVKKIYPLSTNMKNIVLQRGLLGKEKIERILREVEKDFNKN